MLTILLVHMPARAHKVNLFAYVEGDQVVVEGYFSKDARAQDCLVQVFDQQGKKLLEGKTDKKGMYYFKLADLPSLSGGLKIVLEAGMGHRADYTLSDDDLPKSVKKQAEPEKPAQPEEQVQSQEQEKPSREATPQDSSSSAPAMQGAEKPVVDQAALTAALEAALDKKLAPITRMMAKQEQLLLEEKFGGPKMTDIIGGIGWIVGMVGIAGFFWGSKRSARK
jgi:nickel transport protein